MLFQRPGLLRRDGKITEETTLYRNNSDVREINCRNDKTIFTKSKWYGFYNDIDSCRSTNWYLIEFLFSHHTKYMHNSYCNSSLMNNKICYKYEHNYIIIGLNYSPKWYYDFIPEDFGKGEWLLLFSSRQN